jgi:hypothetical protein
MAPLDRAMRPLQRAYFMCCHACSDDERAASAVSTCVQDCVTPVARVNAQLQSATELLQQRLGRCEQVAMEAAGEGGSGEGSSGEEARKRAFVARMRPCVEEEVGKLSRQLEAVRASVAPALEEVQRLGASGGVSRRRGLEMGEGKKSWW